MKVEKEVKDKPLNFLLKRFSGKKEPEQDHKEAITPIVFNGEAPVNASMVGVIGSDLEPTVESHDKISYNSLAESDDAAEKSDSDTASSTLESQVEYFPDKVLESIKGIGNKDIHAELQTIIPIHHNIPMPELLEVFKQYPQHTFFPVVDERRRPLGIIQENKLKKFVYSRFGSTLLENPILKNKLTDFIEFCTMVDINETSEKILQTFSDAGTTEGVIVTHNNQYVGVISLRSLVRLGHEREMSLQELHSQILEQKNNDINNILQNMKQGIFTILEDGTIHHDYSTYLETVFETTEIEGKNYFELLFSSCNLGTDKLAQTRSVIENSIGEDVLTFEVNSHALVEEYQLVFENNRIKHIELFWNPIIDDEEIVNRFIVNIRDKTEIVELQEQALRQQREFKIITQVFSITRDTFEDFIKSTREYVDSCFDLLRDSDRFDIEIIAHVFRNLHTIKGNSRLYGFDELTDVVHDVEEVITQVRSREIPYNPKKLVREIDKVSSVLEQYDSVVQNKLKGFLETKKSGVFLDDQLFTSLKNTVNKDNCEEIIGTINTILKTKKILGAMETISLNSIFDDIKSSVESMARIVKKPKPNVIVNANNIRVTREISSTLNIVIMHSIRNSLSHGFEDEETRKKIGKPQNGNIQLLAGFTDNNFFVEYQDDGAGLDLRRIMEKAHESGLVKVNKPLGARQIAQFIFCPGLSTAENVTEIAGRGVGMDAILKAMNNIGGSIDIHFQNKNSNLKKRPFRFIFKFPRENAQILD